MFGNYDDWFHGFYAKTNTVSPKNIIFTVPFKTGLFDEQISGHGNREALR